jgi:hypothetical protein
MTNGTYFCLASVDIEMTMPLICTGSGNSKYITLHQTFLKRKQDCRLKKKIFFWIQLHMKLFQFDVGVYNLFLHMYYILHPACEGKICTEIFKYVVIPQHLSMNQLWMKSRFPYWIVTCATCGCSTETSMWLKAWYVQAMLRGVKMLVRYCILISSANKLTDEVVLATMLLYLCLCCQHFYVKFPS